MYRLCLSILGDSEDAADATQEAFIAALKALASYRGESAFQTWLLAIAINTSRGHLRQRKRQANLKQSVTDETMRQDQSRQSLEGQVMQSQHNEAVWRAVSGLDEKHRLPIVLRYYHDLSTQEIADTLGINVGTVHSRLSNARNRLLGELKRANVPLAGSLGGEP